MTKTATPEMIKAAAKALRNLDSLAWDESSPLEVYIEDAKEILNAALAASPPTAAEPVAVKPLDMFMHSVDAWGAAEWFGRLADAVRGHDAARMSGDEFADITADTFKNIMTSSAFRLARDFEAQVRSALATPSTDHPEDFTAEFRQQHKELIEEAGKLREENERLKADHAKVVRCMQSEIDHLRETSIKNSKERNAFERVNAALTERLEMAERNQAVLKSAAAELAASYQGWAEMEYDIARQYPDHEAQDNGAYYSREARKFLFAIIGDGSGEDRAALAREGK